MTEHLGYEKNCAAGNNSVNNRNGYGKKRIVSDYGECEIAVPQGLISKITDKILQEVNEWQSRPLEKIYPVIYFDEIVFIILSDCLKCSENNPFPMT